jgi:SAM-dependent methyltransferase
MDLSSFQSLFTDDGERALEAAAALRPEEKDFLRHFTNLSREFPKELARAALETAIHRRDATVKFPETADKWYFTREALEQASSAAVASHRARRYGEFGKVIDLGCSVGGDLLTLAARACVVADASTIGIDNDPLRLAMATANARALGLDDRTSVVLADLESPLPVARNTDTALFFDPGRREGERRARSVRDYRPPLDVIRAWLTHWPALGVKIAPAVRILELAEYEAEIEFISLHGELKEAVLWFGPLRQGRRRATVLPGPYTMAGEPDRESRRSLPPILSEPRAYLYEPDPAIIRAGLVRAVGVDLDAAQIDPGIAFLTSDDRIDTPFARAHAIEDWMPFNLKRLRAYLRERNVGKVTVKKRGSPIDAERCAHDLKLPGEEHRLIVLTKLNSKAIVVVCR